ncbi:MAG: hypothetical protein EOP06_10845, partial [Proteobacteria bacterium]
MNKREVEQMQQVDHLIQNFESQNRRLKGIRSRTVRNVLLMQMNDAIRRIQYVRQIGSRPISPSRADPWNELMFDPLYAAKLKLQGGNVEEAFWLVYLATHFGKNKTTGWNLARKVYCG